MRKLCLPGLEPPSCFTRLGPSEPEPGRFCSAAMLFYFFRRVLPREGSDNPADSRHHCRYWYGNWLPGVCTRVFTPATMTVRP